MNICLCGSEAGYPHHRLCPYPLYHGSEAQEERWTQARERLLASVNEDNHASGIGAPSPEDGGLTAAPADEPFHTDVAGGL